MSMCVCSPAVLRKMESKRIVVDENNSFYLADPDAHYSGPPSLKVGRKPVVR